MFNSELLYDRFKSIFVVILSTLILIVTILGFQVPSAKANGINNSGCESCSATPNPEIESLNIEENDGIITENFSDGSILTEYEDGTMELTVPLASPFFSDEQRETILESSGAVQTRSFRKLVEILVKIVEGIFFACEVIEWLSNYTFNPCEVARQYLGSRARSGRYVIEGEYIPGRVPGCEPMHSLPCNSGYYKYRFIPS